MAFVTGEACQLQSSGGGRAVRRIRVHGPARWCRLELDIAKALRPVPPTLRTTKLKTRVGAGGGG
eukprot:1267597-Pyramimonas_sp.AAC.1